MGGALVQKCSKWQIVVELIEYFPPESWDFSVDPWLNKIDHLGLIHKWTEYEKMYFLYLKLADLTKT